MLLYRISSGNHINDLSGTGSMLFGGRWNKKGVKMLYTSESLSLAALETLANLSADKIDRKLYCCILNFPDHLPISELKSLPKTWNSFPYSSGTIIRGTEFVKNGELCLKVPSAIIPSEYNYLLNPEHPDYRQITIISTQPLMLDKRILK